jgi:hypothetical protein
MKTFKFTVTLGGEIVHTRFVKVTYDSDLDSKRDKYIAKMKKENNEYEIKVTRYC